MRSTWILVAGFVLASCNERAQSSADAGKAIDASLDASVDASVPVTYSDLGDRTKWATFDLTSFNGSARGFRGAAFDGRYVYRRRARRPARTATATASQAAPTPTAGAVAIRRARRPWA